MNLTIDTGTPRSVTGHVISGALTASIIAAGIGYSYNLKQKSKSKKLTRDIVKLGLQGGVATGSAIATTNYLGNKEYLKALLSLGIGFCGVLAVDQVINKCDESKEVK